MNSGRRFFPRSLFGFLLVLMTLFILPVTLRLASAQRKAAADKAREFARESRCSEKRRRERLLEEDQRVHH